MQTLRSHTDEPRGLLIKASLPAAALALLLAVVLKFTMLPVGLKTAMSVFTFLVAQSAMIRWVTGRPGSVRYWLTVAAIATAAAAGTWMIAEM